MTWRWCSDLNNGLEWPVYLPDLFALLKMFNISAPILLLFLFFELKGIFNKSKDVFSIKPVVFGLYLHYFCLS